MAANHSRTATFVAQALLRTPIDPLHNPDILLPTAAIALTGKVPIFDAQLRSRVTDDYFKCTDDTSPLYQLWQTVNTTYTNDDDPAQERHNDTESFYDLSMVANHFETSPLQAINLAYLKLGQDKAAAAAHFNLPDDQRSKHHLLFAKPHGGALFDHGRKFLLRAPPLPDSLRNPDDGLPYVLHERHLDDSQRRFPGSYPGQNNARDLAATISPHLDLEDIIAMMRELKRHYPAPVYDALRKKTPDFGAAKTSFPIITNAQLLAIAPVPDAVNPQPFYTEAALFPDQEPLIITMSRLNSATTRSQPTATEVQAHAEVRTAARAQLSKSLGQWMKVTKSAFTTGNRILADTLKAKSPLLLSLEKKLHLRHRLNNLTRHQQQSTLPAGLDFGRFDKHVLEDARAAATKRFFDAEIEEIKEGINAQTLKIDQELYAATSTAVEWVYPGLTYLGVPNYLQPAIAIAGLRGAVTRVRRELAERENAFMFTKEFEELEHRKRNKAEKAAIAEKTKDIEKALEGGNADSIRNYIDLRVRNLLAEKNKSKQDDGKTKAAPRGRPRTREGPSPASASRYRSRSTTTRKPTPGPNGPRRSSLKKTANKESALRNPQRHVRIKDPFPRSPASAKRGAGPLTRSPASAKNTRSQSSHSKGRSTAQKRG